MNDRYQKIKDYPDMVKDTKTGDIIANDLSSYKSYKLKRKNRDMIYTHEKEIHNIKEDITEIKFLLKELINKKEDE